MTLRRITLCYSAGLLMAGTGLSFAAGAAVSDADKAFVAKVSQGGMFEVEASRLVADKGVQQDVIDTGATEVHDHDGVGDKLKGIAGTLGLPFPTALDADFQKRFDRLKGLSGKAFDDAYIGEMKVIHAADGAAFAKEAQAGTAPALKSFAAETVLIVRRHIGALAAVPLPAK